MAVYTHIDEKTLTAFLSDYDVGVLKSFEGIAKGVSNTNYHVFTDKGRYILTIFEEHRTRREDLPFLFAYAGHLAGHGVPCPQAYMDRYGRVIKDIQGKAAALINFLEGDDIPRGETMPDHCAQMGAFTSLMHSAALDFPLSKPNDWGMAMWREKAEAMRARMDGYEAGLEDIIFKELDYLEANWPEELPQAVVHIDLFPDNIFFVNGKIAAMIDMYFACIDLLVYDLAIVVNSWCFDARRNFLPENFEQLISGYEAGRALKKGERAAFQTICRAASMRFLLSRLQEFFNYDPKKALMTPHDPREYLQKLRFHQGRDILND